MSVESWRDGLPAAGVVADELLAQNTDAFGRALLAECLPRSAGFSETVADDGIGMEYATIATGMYYEGSDPDVATEAYLDGLAMATAMTGTVIREDGWEPGQQPSMVARFRHTLAESVVYLEQSQLAQDAIEAVCAFDDDGEPEQIAQLLGLQMGLILAGHTEIQTRKIEDTIRQRLAARGLHSVARNSLHGHHHTGEKQ